MHHNILMYSIKMHLILADKTILVLIYCASPKIDKYFLLYIYTGIYCNFEACARCIDYVFHI